MIAGLLNDAQRYGRTLISLAQNDFRARYVGSYLGMFWAFAQPIVTILIFWFVFQFGMRTSTVDNVPFLVWLVCGLVPWFFFSDAWLTASQSLVEYSYLVKKVVFRVSFLPIIKIISAIFIHAIFLILLFGLCLAFNVRLELATLQVLYYSAAAACLTFSLSLLSASVLPFFPDLRPLITIGLQFGMWLTPIMWDDSRVPQAFLWVLELNPMYYIVEGYRGSILRTEWFWERPLASFIFWITVGFLAGLGLFVYRRLRPHFADVL